MIDLAIYQPSAAYAQRAFDGDVAASAAAVSSMPSSLVQDRYQPAYDGAVDLPFGEGRGLFDSLARSSRAALDKVTWLKDNLAPMEVAVKRLMQEIAAVRKTEDGEIASIKQREDYMDAVGGNLKKAADALAGMRSPLLNP